MKKKDAFVSVIKGVITGVASLIPGISPASSIVAVSSYDNFITGLSSIFSKKTNKKKTEKNQKVLFLITIPIILGIIIGLIVGSNLVSYFLGKYRPQTIFLFIGLVVGGIYMIFKKERTKPTKSTIIVFLISSLIVFLLYMVFTKYINSIPDVLVPVLGGILTSLTVLIPGISLSYVYNLLDKYNYIAASIVSLSSIKSILVVLVFVILFILSIVFIAKLISYFLRKYKNESYAVICSLMVLSTVIMLLEVGKFTISFVNIFTTILAFLWGVLLAKNIEKE